VLHVVAGLHSLQRGLHGTGGHQVASVESRCNRLLAGRTYCCRFIGGAIHLPSSDSAFGH